MKLKPSKIWLPVLVLALVGGWLVLSTLFQRRGYGQDVAWETTASPGPLSKAHAFLANNCAGCHTANKGVEAASCIACHANDQALLQRQPTAFHANMQSCVECHTEHEGVERRRPPMNHEALAQLLRRQIDSDAASGDATAVAARPKLAA